MKKIAVITPEFPPNQWGGLAKTVHMTAKHLNHLGYCVHVLHFSIVPDPLILLDENRFVEERDGLIVHHITVGREIQRTEPSLWNCPHNLTLQMMGQCIEKLHYEEHFDVLHSFFLYPMGYVTGLLSKRFKLPHIVTIVGNDVKRYIFSPEKAFVCKSGLENSDIVVALSADLVEMADALFPIHDKSRIIYNSVKQPQNIWAKGRNSNIVVGCAGIFKYAKGLPYLFKAIGEIVQRHNITLELVGQVRESEAEMLEWMTDRTDLRDVLVLKPAIPHDEIPNWLRGLDIFVLPSLTEGCPNILMEALAVGLPCIATRTGANDVLIEDGRSGLLAPWGDSTAILGALEKLINDPKLAAGLGRAASERMKLFSQEVEREAWKSVYEEID